MDSLLQLVIFSAVMFLGSYGAGSVPLFMPMSEEKLHLVSVMGAGLLVGVAFAVIVPEGMQTLVKAYQLKSPGGGSSKDGVVVEHHDDDPLEGIDKAIGVSLVLGFVFMLLVDQIAAAAAHSGGGGSQMLPTVEPSSSSEVPTKTRHRRPSSSVSWTTTLGLVVHAAADGVALGAAAATNQMDVEIIVFLAIMLHKAPAAFGLVTFLLHEAVERQRTRKHLITFSLSAPTMAILTYVLLMTNMGDAEGQQVNTFKATGVAMLFSAGTFIYVSTVHVLPEVTNIGGRGFSKCELLMLVAGTLLPLLLTMGHHH